MAKIHIGGSLYFTADTMNYILYECGEREKIDIRTKKPTGEMTEYETILGYYGDIGAMVRGARNYTLRKKIIGGELRDIEAVVDEISRLIAWEDEVLGRLA